VDSEPAAQATAKPARPGLRPLAARFACVAGLVALDLWSKAVVFARLGPPLHPLEGAPVVYDAHGHPRERLIGDWLAFMTSLNPGMAWGFDRLPTHVLVLGRAAAVLLLVWLVARSPVRRGLMTWALVLVLAGALGNLHDNLLTESDGRPFGMVRDFIDVYFPIWDWHFPTFNVADSCISVGAVLLFLASWKKDAPNA
jgi:lipoprotein signal peptidase